MRAAAVAKIGRLARRASGLARADVHFTEQRNPRIADKEVCEVILDGRGHHACAKVTAPDGFVAIDRAVDKLEHQLRRDKTKVLRRDTGLSPRQSALGANGSAAPRPS